jgi:NAD(P)-dependent dehydrogenase (short-subunit alcohol dehydrogenase family)
MSYFHILICILLLFYSKVSVANSILITGGNQGIGWGFATHYLDKGYKVYATYRSKENSKDLLFLKNKNLVPIQVDFEKPEQAVQTVKSIIKDNPLDVLILNAGYFAYKANKFGELEAEDLIRSYTVNTISPLLLVQELRENLKSGKNQKIIAISSRCGSIKGTKDEKYTGRFAYRGSKSALNSEMSALALEIPEMTVLILHPCRVSAAFTKFDPQGITVQESVKGMLRVITTSQPKQSGMFYDCEGKEIPW